MKSPFPPVRLYILLALLASIALFTALVLAVTPLILSFAPQAAHQSHQNYLWVTPPLAVILVTWVYLYLTPIARLRRVLKRGDEPAPEMIRSARRAAFNAPVYLFVTLMGAILTATLLVNIIGPLAISGYELAPYFSESLFVLAATVSTGLLLALVARWQLRPVLIVTFHLIPRPSLSLAHEGQRFTIRTRLLVIILALNVVAAYLPSTLVLDLVYRAVQEAAPTSLIQQTLSLLLAFNAAILGFTFFFALVIAADITDDLRQVTQRLSEVALRGEVGEQLPILSLDEIGDLVDAFNDVQMRIQAQQETLQQEHRRLLSLQAISSRISTIYDLDQLLHELTKSARTIFGYYNTLIALVDEKSKELYVASSGCEVSADVSASRFSVESEGSIQGSIQRAVGSGEPLSIPDISQSDFHIVSGPSVRSAVVTPMTVGGKLVGIFVAESDESNGFEKQDVQLMTSLANQAAATIEAARLLQKSRANAEAMAQWARNLMIINRVATILSASLDAYEILDIAVRHLVELTGVDYGSTLMLEQDEKHGTIIAEHPESQLGNLRIKVSIPSNVREALDAGNAYQIDTVREPKLVARLRQQHPSMEFQSLLLVPMSARGETIGILLLGTVDERREFTDEEQDICRTIASQTAVAVANARLLQDIQQQQRALFFKSQELTAQTNKLDTILNSVADGLVVVDSDGNVILSNPVFRQMMNLPGEDSLRDRPLVEYCTITELQDIITQTLQSPIQGYTKNIALQSGQVLKASTTPLHLPSSEDKEQHSLGVVTVLREITREVELDQAKTNFITAVSHELRTPLTSILGFASLIQRDLQRRIVPHLDSEEEPGQAVSRIQHNLAIIEQESMRITRLINDMLDIAKIEAGQMEWRMEETNLTGVIDQAVTATTALAEEKNLPVQIHLPSGKLPPVWADQDRISQVMTNLLANAIKFTERGDIEVRGWILSVKDGSLECTDPIPTLYDSVGAIQENLTKLGFSDGTWVVVSVTDTGVGIKPDDIPYVFEKYRQVGDVAASPLKGTGLGLPISKEIVEHHGGRIWVESKQGKGSTFSFALPVDSSRGKES
jgi:signal transduction histidine kinase/GAF domain-containing protein